MFAWLTERRRNKLLEHPFPEEWKKILAKNVAAYRLLDTEEKERLHELVQVFVEEKNWEGCGGLELDDEIRVTIAGSGCLMLLGRDHDLFKEVESILVYPSAVIHKGHGRSTFDPGVTADREEQVVLGLAVHGGAVVLAWDSVLQGAANARDGHNVVIHEFAHKIDFTDGDADGTPDMGFPERRAWAAAFEPAFLAHKKRADQGKKSFLRDYAVTNEAEYFAVVSEAFFEKPKELARQLPDVYASLRDFYRLDLAARDSK